VKDVVGLGQASGTKDLHGVTSTDSGVGEGLLSGV